MDHRGNRYQLEISVPAYVFGVVPVFNAEVVVRKVVEGSEHTAQEAWAGRT